MTETPHLISKNPGCDSCILIRIDFNNLAFMTWVIWLLVQVYLCTNFAKMGPLGK